MKEFQFRADRLWSVPVLTVSNENCREINRGLARAIEEKESEIISKGKATPVAGLEEGLTTHWMEYNVLNWDIPEAKELARMVLAGARQFFSLVGDPDDPDYEIQGISCWANILRPGQSLTIHHHDPGFVSAHYCVASGVDPYGPSPVSESGCTQYYRPGFIERSMGGAQAGIASIWDDDWKLSERPVEGRLFFFPSFVRHEVRPNLERFNRITIAMDIYIKKQPSSQLIYFAPPRWFVPPSGAR